MAFVCFSFFFLSFCFLAARARLSWQHSAFQSMLNSIIISYRDVEGCARLHTSPPPPSGLQRRRPYAIFVTKTKIKGRTADGAALIGTCPAVTVTHQWPGQRWRHTADDGPVALTTDCCSIRSRVEVSAAEHCRHDIPPPTTLIIIIIIIIITIIRQFVTRRHQDGTLPADVDDQLKPAPLDRSAVST